MSCPLCELKEKKVIHKETHEFIIIDCASCDVPMIVWKAHTMEPGDEELEVMEKELKIIKHVKSNIDEIDTLMMQLKGSSNGN